MSDAKAEPAPGQWAIVELMGHVRLAGRLSEEERFGTRLGRLDVPLPDGGFVTKLFGGGSVYAVTFVDEAAARAVAARGEVRPVHSWELPRALPEAGGADAAAPPPFDYPDSDDDPDRLGY